MPTQINERIAKNSLLKCPKCGHNEFLIKTFEEEVNVFKTRIFVIIYCRNTKECSYNDNFENFVKESNARTCSQIPS